MASHPEFGFHTTAAEVAAAFSDSVRGKTIVVTGVGPNGIGEATAAALAEHAPATLVLTARTPSRVYEVIEKLKPRFPAIDYVFLELDLASLSSVRTAAAILNANPSIPSIDILINNAGVMAVPTRTWTADGIELQFATNHIGHFLFTNLILPKLIAASEAHGGGVRIVNVSSYGHRFSPIRFSDPNFSAPDASLPDTERPNAAMLKAVFNDAWADPSSSSPKADDKGDSPSYIPFSAYGQSKTANILFSVSLTRKLASKHGITSFSLHPGSIETELQRHISRDQLHEARERAKARGLAQGFKSREQGASTSPVAALDPHLQTTVTGNSVSGIYLLDCQAADAACEAWARDVEAAERLWKLSEVLVREKFVW